MRKLTIISLALVAVWGCSQPQPSPSATASAATAAPAAVATPSVKVAYDTGSIKKGDKGHCVVCVVKEGSREVEPVAETLDYKGKTYVFCNESEKAEFISNPTKYASQ
jgi:hypothetical protein